MELSFEIGIKLGLSPSSGGGVPVDALTTGSNAPLTGKNGTVLTKKAA